MKNKVVATSIFFLFSGKVFSQKFEIVEEEKPKTFVKANAAFLPLGVVNAGIEHKISPKFTIQGDILISPWKSFAGHELQYYSLSFETRYYFNEAFKHWFIGGNIALSTFQIQKWNYWNDNFLVDRDTGLVTPYKSSDIYQKGFSYLIGITGGYQFNLGRNWNMELYATIGNSQDFYKGYHRPSGDRYDKAKKFNKSGEWIPYRGGIMFSYKLK